MISGHFKGMTDTQLLDTYYAIKGVINECGIHETSTRAYIDCTTEIANRYFSNIGLIELENREKLIEILRKAEK